jgi:hypothetical protein
MRRRLLSRLIWLGPSLSSILASCDSGRGPPGVSIKRPASACALRSLSASRTTKS